MHHVYVDYRKDLNTPFYVGEGNDARIADFKNRNVIWHRIVKKHGVRREILLTIDDHAAVLAEEIRLVKLLGTRDHRGGANMTDGGEGSLGWHPTLETRQHMREAKLGKKFSAEHRKNMSEAHIERYRSPEAREKTSQAWKRVLAEPEFRRRLKAARTGEGNARAVLTEGDVRQLRSDWALVDAAVRGTTKLFCMTNGVRLGVTSASIYGIITERSWKHVK